MRGIEDMNFTTVKNRDGKFVGRVREFTDLRSKPKTNALDAIDEIIDLTRDRIADITTSQQKAAGQ